VRDNQVKHKVATMCRLLEVSPSGYYAWRGRKPSKRAMVDSELSKTIRAIHEESKGTYGAPRIHADLLEKGSRVGRKRVSRLMRMAAIAGVSRRRGFKTTRRDPNASPATDLVERNFVAEGPDQLWVADITYIPTWAGFLYLAVVLDVWSRKIVGWAMQTHLHSQLVLDALNMAIWQRRPAKVIHHSDHDTQYTSLVFGARCDQVGVRHSMGSVGDNYSGTGGLRQCDVRELLREPRV
jgi:putative transposase